MNALLLSVLPQPLKAIYKLMERTKAKFDTENGIAATIREKNDCKEVTYINKDGKKLIQAIIMGSTVTYKLSLK